MVVSCVCPVDYNHFPFKNPQARAWLFLVCVHCGKSYPPFITGVKIAPVSGNLLLGLAHFILPQLCARVHDLVGSIWYFHIRDFFRFSRLTPVFSSVFSHHFQLLNFLKFAHFLKFEHILGLNIFQI
jgi:hypothetical protein